MSQEVIPVRSKNNNVFRYCSYFHHWSRILFHDAGGRGMLGMRNKHNIPNSTKTVEIDITPINGFNTSYWREDLKTHLGRVRFHCTDLGRDRITMNLPPEVYEEMKKHFTEEQINCLLHDDVLPLVDFTRKQGSQCVLETNT